MKVYRVSGRNEDGHQGYSWHGNKADAERAVKGFIAEGEPTAEKIAEYAELGRTPPTNDNTAEYEQINVVTTKAGILQALNYFAVHNNNG